LRLRSRLANGIFNMKAQQAIAVVKESRPFAPYPLKALSYGVFGVIFFGLPASAFASQTLDALVSAAAGFSSAIQQQLDANPLAWPTG
jgi:hypothetical protein